MPIEWSNDTNKVHVTYLSFRGINPSTKTMALGNCSPTWTISWLYFSIKISRGHPLLRSFPPVMNTKYIFKNPISYFLNKIISLKLCAWYRFRLKWLYSIGSYYGLQVVCKKRSTTSQKRNILIYQKVYIALPAYSATMSTPRSPSYVCTSETYLSNVQLIYPKYLRLFRIISN